MWFLFSYAVFPTAKPYLLSHLRLSTFFFTLFGEKMVSYWGLTLFGECFALFSWGLLFSKLSCHQRFFQVKFFADFLRFSWFWGFLKLSGIFHRHSKSTLISSWLQIRCSWFWAWPLSFHVRRLRLSYSREKLSYCCDSEHFPVFFLSQHTFYSSAHSSSRQQW